MPGYEFQTTLTITNPTNTEQTVKIERGMIIEPESTHLSFQSAVVSKDYIFILNPKETRSVILDVECWNKNLDPPKGVPGKLTALKGNIKKTTNIWGVSSNPAKKTLSIKPSQDAHVPIAFINANPDLGHDFLDRAALDAEADGANLSKMRVELGKTSSLPPNKKRSELCRIARKSDLASYTKAANLRKFFIEKGKPTNELVDAIEQTIIGIYASTSHRLAANLYDVAIGLVELSDNKKIAVADDQRDELTQLIRRKYMSLLDSLPLLDEVEW